MSSTTIPTPAETGVEVDYSTYESNEELMAKLQIGAGGYDLVVPTGYIVTVLAAQNLLHPLDKALLPNWSNVAPMFHSPKFDEGSKEERVSFGQSGADVYFGIPGEPGAATAIADDRLNAMTSASK